MASYKVSYKILKQQGENIKAAAKLADSYSERIAQVSGKLGDDALLAEIRQNLGKLRTQLGESRTVLNTAGELLLKTVEGYTGTETRQVKKVDGYKAHNRDFYKRPVVVASVCAGAGAATVAGAAAGAGAASGTSQGASGVTVNYTDNSVHMTYSQASEPLRDSTPVTGVEAGRVSASRASAVSSARGNTPSVAPASPAASSASDTAKAVAAGVGVGALGGAAAAAGIAAGIKAKKRKNEETEEKKEKTESNLHDAYDPETELEKAIKRLHDLEQE